MTRSAASGARAGRPLDADVVVLGGGPGGSAAGLTLLKRDGLAVTMVEASDYVAPRIGESLTPGVRPLLEYLDVWDAFSEEQALDAFGSRAAWGSATPRALDYLFTVHGSGWTLDRARLDRLLAETFRARGGRLLTRTRFLGCTRTSDGWEVRVRVDRDGLGRDSGDPDDRGEERVLRCRFLVDATGRPARLARWLGVARTVHDRLVGVARVGTLPPGRDQEAVVQVEACAYGWWYTAPTPGGRLATVLMSDVDLVRRADAADPDRWEALAADLPMTREGLDGVRFDDDPRVFPAATASLRRAGGDGWVAVGDAVASHDPLSSTGIAHALGTGTQAALVVANALFGDGRALAAYQQAVRADFARHLRTHWQVHQAEARWPDAPFWARRRTPVTLAPDTVVPDVLPVGDSTFDHSVHLDPRLARRLHAALRPGRTAHEVVAAFAADHPGVPDQRIILGVQELVGTDAAP
ncbi:tryptophan 7-halogenase [Salsipaludibacter albus]|uniref:tryptophan 7-halogenase n=1 Tax=Salsipaludibacter albus TaxID=2849650 RepID=UPI001EE40466|nr:NAD(P)/FAD-dependent oxidoreductase [Salsipaludibacter albus]